MLKPKVGDLVRLKPFLVGKVDPHDHTFQIGEGGGGGLLYGMWVRNTDIEEIISPPFAIGERVLLTVGGDCPSDVYGKIVAIDSKTGWVRRDDGLYATAALDELRRAANDGEGRWPR